MEIMHQPTCMMTYGKSFAILAYCRDQASSPPNGGGWERIRRKRCERKRKHDKRAGVHARLKTNPSQPELPSILLSNICSLDNKLNYIRLQRTRRLPAYRPLIRRSKLVLKQVRTWPAGVISALQDCFECTNWDMFREAATNGKTTDLEEYTSSVTSYISKCIDDVTISKSITTHSNQKPWMTAKRTHGHFQSSGDTRSMWQGNQSITNYRPASPACDSDTSLPDALNSFYTQFEARNDVTARKTIPPPEDQVLCFTMADVRKTLHRVNSWKASGPDNIPGRVLRQCAEQLADVFTDNFNISLSSIIIPTCLKSTTIIPVPKKSSVSCLNDYRPVALTPIIMKCFERLVMRHIKNLLPPSLDTMQFAYRPNRSTDDAISTTWTIKTLMYECCS
ncbi:hypothetical protein QTP86_010015 [Hemibagrus guttatus]|nr:hypothetical protein QTP86_010015 [Hemibagrus guttatus]